MDSVLTWVALVACLREWCGWHGWGACVGGVLAWVTWVVCLRGRCASVDRVGGVLAWMAC